MCFLRFVAHWRCTIAQRLALDGHVLRLMAQHCVPFEQRLHCKCFVAHTALERC